jgi:hypothetical protein
VFEHKRGHWLTVPRAPEKPKKEHKKLGVIVLEDGTQGTVVELFNSKRNPGLGYQTILYRLKKGVRSPDALFAPQHNGVSL